MRSSFLLFLAVGILIVCKSYALSHYSCWNTYIMVPLSSASEVIPSAVTVQLKLSPVPCPRSI